jgi:3-oxoadipate enol-lactonase
VSRVDVDGVGIAYRLDGDPEAPSVVLLNSVGCDLHMWDPHVDSLGADLRVVRYDARGHGASDAPPPPYTLDRLGGDLIGLLDALAITRAHVVGASLGGLVGLWIAVRHPDRVDRAVFAGTAARIGTAELWQERADAVRTGGTEAVAGHVMTRFFSEGFRRDHADIVARYAAVLRVQSPRGYEGTCLALRDADLREEVASISTPSLIVVGDQDVATPIEEAESLHETIGQSRLIALEGAGHLCSVERPEAFDEAVGRFLRGEELT